jgi:hypothetical protein
LIRAAVPRSKEGSRSTNVAISRNNSRCSALSASTKKRTDLDVRRLPAGREIGFVPDKYLS